MWIDIKPLIKNRNYRCLYLGQLVSTLGSMVTYVALPYQIYQITHSSLAVGVMGIVELAPLLVTALVGGVYADSMDRKKLLIYSEIGLAIGTLLLMVNSHLPHPQLWLIYVTAAFMSAVNGFHRPALESLTPRLIPAEDIPSISSLGTLKGLLGTICGPAIGGFLIATSGIATTYFLDFISFVISLIAVSMIKIPPFKNGENVVPIKGIQEGIRYAGSRQELIGSYVIDFVAMVFGMPMALFPAVSENFGGAKIVGLFYAAPSAGAMIATLMSGWTKKVTRVGLAISISALIWGIGITAFGFSNHLWTALFCLMVAGAADAMSGVFRLTLWNQTIPDKLRGRLAGLEMISYMSGPLLGNAESGFVAAAFSTQFSIVSGGVLCILGVSLCILGLPKFWKYQLPRNHS